MRSSVLELLYEEDFDIDKVMTKPEIILAITELSSFEGYVKGLEEGIKMLQDRVKNLEGRK